jgi:hypothetical protein
MGLLSGSLDEFEGTSWRERTGNFGAIRSYWSLAIVLPWLLGATIFIWQWHVDSRAAARQATTSGLVTEVARGSRVHYEFAIAQHVYRNWEIPLYDRPVPSAGETVKVYYDSEMQAVNAITDFHEKSVDALGPVPLTLFLSSVGIFAILRRIRSSRALISR